MGTVTENVLYVLGALVVGYILVVLYKAIKIALHLGKLEKKYGITIIDTYMVGNASVARIYDPDVDSVYEILVMGSPKAAREFYQQKDEGVYDSFIDTLF